MIMENLGKIKDVVDENTIVISLAPKITIEKMAGVLPTSKVARLIPNATSFINKGYNPVCFSQSFDKEKKKATLKMLKVLGKPLRWKNPSSKVTR